MPTVVLLDVSLSMTRPVTPAEGSSSGAGGDVITRRQLAEAGLSALFDFVAANDRLEFTSLVIFSSLWEVVVPFTRDYAELKKALLAVETFDKTNLEVALEGVRNMVVEEWGVSTPCQIILVTDGSPGVGPGSLKQVAQMLADPKPDDPPFPLPFEFANSLHVVLLSSAAELQRWNSRALCQRLVEANRQNGTVHSVEGALAAKSVQQMFAALAEAHYAAFRARLVCGHLSSEVQLFPPPQRMSAVRDFEVVAQTVSSELSICGFLDCSDVCSPPVISRHLVLPLPTKEKSSVSAGEGGAEGGDKAEDNGPSPAEVGSTPSFCVLLHGSLKVENLVALVNVGENWYGLLHSCADSKKKSNLMMSLFEHGDKAIPWLGRFHLLGPCSAFASDPYGEESSKSPFPVRLQDKRSYSQNPVVWIKPNALQTDIQKILRYARKLPEKTQVFYKELNRLRRAALSLGMVELLTGMSQMLERECTILPWTAHPDAAMQLTHAAKLMTSAAEKGYNYSIIPLSTNFATDT